VTLAAECVVSVILRLFAPVSKHRKFQDSDLFHFASLDLYPQQTWMGLLMAGTVCPRVVTMSGTETLKPTSQMPGKCACLPRSTLIL
jgi:hypothetical protein